MREPLDTSFTNETMILAQLSRSHARADRLADRLAAAAAAFVVETRRAPGDHDPARRFRAHLPGGALAYGATREEAEAKFWAAVEKAREGGGG